MSDIVRTELAIHNALQTILNASRKEELQDKLQGAYEDLKLNVINKLKQENWFFAHLPKEECAHAVYSDGTITYAYEPNTAPAFNREFYSKLSWLINQYETASFANLSACLVDKHLKSPDDAIVNLWQAMISNCVRGISNLFNDMVIRGDVSAPKDSTDQAKGPAAFDGLDKIIKKESPHVWDIPLDLTCLGDNAMDDFNYEVLMSRFDCLCPYPTFILGNNDLISQLSWLGQRLRQRPGTYAQYARKTIDDFGHTMSSIDGVDLVPMGWRNGQYGKDIIPTEKVKVDDLPPEKRPRYYPDGYAYVTKAYVGSFGRDAVQGFILPGNAHDLYRNIVDQIGRDADAVQGILPGNPVTVQLLEDDGWVTKWLVEMLIGMRVMSRDACGMFTTVYLPKASISFPEHVVARQ